MNAIGNPVSSTLLTDRSAHPRRTARFLARKAELPSEFVCVRDGNLRVAGLPLNADGRTGGFNPGADAVRVYANHLT